MHQLNRPRTEELQTILAQGRSDRAVAILQRLDPKVAADAFMSLPYEEQQVPVPPSADRVRRKAGADLSLLPHVCSAPQPRERPNDRGCRENESD